MATGLATSTALAGGVKGLTTCLWEANVPEMKVAVEGSDLATSSASALRVWPFRSTLVFLALVWLEATNQLKGEWSLNPQYSYGWSVPLLLCYLLWRRWSERPSPSPPTSSFLPVVITVFCACLFFPVRLLAEANPDWRLLSWSVALIAVTISLCLVYLTGGWPWVRYFAFPFFFFLVAVPWPTRIEEVVIQDLMRVVSAINVTLINAVGIPAVQHGNVIEITSGFIGIEEACSGVRSLQGAVMISLFLGELFSFSPWPRLVLLAAGALLAFFCNIIRTAVLVWVGATRGIHAIEGWHDPAGVIILLVCLLGLWVLGSIMQRRFHASVRRPGTEDLHHPLHATALPPPLIIFLTVWLILAETGVQSWYRLHQSVVADYRWDVQWPTSRNDYKSVAIPRQAENLLRYNNGGGAAWKESGDHRWMMFFFRWLPGRTAALFVKVHRPDICLPASGMTMITDHGIRMVNVNGVNLPIRSYRFDDHGAPLHIFYCYWDARSSYENSKAAEEEDWTAWGRVRTALRGRREMGAQMLELAVWDYHSEAEATAALQQQLAQIIQKG